MSEVITDKLTGRATAGDVTITSEGGSATMQLQQGLTKAWLNYKHKSTVSVRDSLNISSVTDTATGYATANYSSNFGNDDYAPVIMGDGDGSSHHTTVCTRATTGDANVTFTTSAHAYYMHNIGGTTIDAIYVTAQYIGDLA